MSEYDRKRLEHQIMITQAILDGKEVQHRNPRVIDLTWHETKSLFTHPDFRMFEYRLKPQEIKPKEIYVNIYSDGYYIGYNNVQDAVRAASFDALKEAVKFIEVIEEKKEIENNQSFQCIHCGEIFLQKEIMNHDHCHRK